MGSFIHQGERLIGPWRQLAPLGFATEHGPAFERLVECGWIERPQQELIAPIIKRFVENRLEGVRHRVELGDAIAWAVPEGVNQKDPLRWRRLELSPACV